MAKPAARREPAIRAIDAPPEWADWDDDGRVVCERCQNKTGDKCAALGSPGARPSCQPRGIKHWCSAYISRGNR